MIGPATQHFMAARMKAERRRKRVILTGDVPSPANPPDGCRFHTRCWLYERLGRPEQCRTIDPELRVERANRTFYDVFRVKREKTEGK